jgi:hypothetical protein
MSLSNISTLLFEFTTTPAPAGTLATAAPLAAKFAMLFWFTLFLNTRVECPGWLRFGILNTRIPPVLPVATFYTSALIVFWSRSRRVLFCWQRRDHIADRRRAGRGGPQEEISIKIFRLTGEPGCVGRLTPVVAAQCLDRDVLAVIDLEAVVLVSSIDRFST